MAQGHPTQRGFRPHIVWYIVDLLGVSTLGSLSGAFAWNKDR